MRMPCFQVKKSVLQQPYVFGVIQLWLLLNERKNAPHNFFIITWIKVQVRIAYKNIFETIYFKFLFKYLATKYIEPYYFVQIHFFRNQISENKEKLLNLPNVFFLLVHVVFLTINNEPCPRSSIRPCRTVKCHDSSTKIQGHIGFCAKVGMMFRFWGVP